MLAFWQGLSPWHLLLVAAIALLFYGNRLPEVARSLGRAVNEFKRGLKDVEGEISRDDTESNDRPPQRLQPPAADKRLEDPDQQEPETQSSEQQPEQEPQKRE